MTQLRSRYPGGSEATLGAFSSQFVEICGLSGGFSLILFPILVGFLWLWGLCDLSFYFLSVGWIFCCVDCGIYLWFFFIWGGLLRSRGYSTVRIEGFNVFLPGGNFDLFESRDCFA
jgi:hypothetical protein